MGEFNEYIGETDGKRLARIKLYQKLQDLWGATKRPNGMFVTLAGPEAAEVGCLKYLIKAQKHEVLFVDKEPEGLVEARRKWPGVGTYQGDIFDVMKNLKAGVAFLNLDFTGYLIPERERVVEESASLFTACGVGAYTFFRGREHLGMPHWRECCDIVPVKKPYAGIDDVRNRRFFDDVRFRAYSQRLNYLGWRELVMMLRYVSIKGNRTSPMGLVAFQNVPAEFHSKEWEQTVAEKPREPRSEDEVEEELKEISVYLYRNGHHSKEISELINVPAGTIAAWLAWDTRRGGS